MARGIRFLFRGAVVELEDEPATTSVLHWLRRSPVTRGTKEGCNQGDCGACTVALAELVDGQVRLTAANSCLLLLPMLDGKALFTVEDVGAPGGLHPVQQALVDCAGSQCGFCTPGFVMSMWSVTERSLRTGVCAPREDLIDALSGNLCRCTGYRPIVDALIASAHHVVEGGSPTVAWESLAEQLKALDQGNAEHMLDIPGFTAPTTEEGLASALAARPDARIIAGGTDQVVAMRANGGLLDGAAAFVSVAAVDSLRRLSLDDDYLVLGAAVPLEEAWAALVGRSPGLERMHRRFAGPAIRSRGTVGGNVANSSPVADLVPVLIALDAEIELRSAQGSRVLPLLGFATGVRENSLVRGEYLARIRVPLASFARDLRAYKVSRRFDDDISSVSGVFGWIEDGDRLVDVRLVFGGMATTVRRATRTEAILEGGQWTSAAVAAAQEALRDDFAPIDDHRASSWYRMQVARGLIERRWHETGKVTQEHDLWVIT